MVSGAIPSDAECSVRPQLMQKPTVPCTGSDAGKLRDSFHAAAADKSILPMGWCDRNSLVVAVVFERDLLAGNRLRTAMSRRS